MDIRPQQDIVGQGMRARHGKGPDMGRFQKTGNVFSPLTEHFL
jgi:hypothetical protein